MYKLPELALNATDAAALANKQRQVNRKRSFPERVAAAKSAFAGKPASLFGRIREKLKLMSGDLVRCAYCEDSCADEVEHVRPKDFYPERVFDWSNYLFSCGPCNTGKNNNYAVIEASGRIVDLVAHRAQLGVIPPPADTEAFIDPRIEEPLDYLWLDLGRSFRFAVLDESDALKAARAEATIRWLKLNRDMLVEARINAFSGYRDRLAQYVARKAAGDSGDQLQNRIRELKRSPHRTVWLEIKRQRSLLPELDGFFRQAPEALSW